MRSFRGAAVPRENPGDRLVPKGDKGDILALQRYVLS